ncbi:hypothetical protein R9X47_00855 [Wukongibacter baidiensis]|uniref:hypothetical protein n=1 Tax=Wukongibacter baidiensis TaxID=1723361 RepID=UPI003D7FCF90
MMKVFSNFFANLRNGLSLLKEHFVLSNILILILLFIVLVIAVLLIFETVRKKTIKSRYRIKRDREAPLKGIVDIIERSTFGKKIIDSITFKICLYNRNSIAKNKEYSVIVLFCFLVFSILLLMMVIPDTKIVWYLTIVYFLLFLGLFYLSLYIFNIMAKRNFSNKMPSTFWLINDRLIYTDNMLKALEVSRNDFDKPVKREIDRVYSALTKNTRAMADNTFKFLEKVYNNKHFTLLLNLIYQGHYKGVTKELKEQFEKTTEEILIELENQRDISFNSRMYIFLTLTFVIFIGLIEKYNINALGDKAMLYYSSPQGIIFKIIILVAIVMHVSILIIMERNA